MMLDEPNITFEELHKIAIPVHILACLLYTSYFKKRQGTQERKESEEEERLV